MALIRPPLAPHALDAYRAAQQVARAPAQRPAPAQAAAPEPQPAGPRSEAQRPALTPRTLSVFAGLLGSETEAGPAGPEQAPAAPPRAASAPQRPRRPGSALDIKI